MILGVSGVGKQFGVDIVLEKVSFRIDEREKVALVGRNGAGKTTLLRIITGQMEPDSGSVNIARGVKVGYLRQESPVGFGRTVLQEAESALEHKTALKRRLEELEATLSQNPTDDDLDEYARVVEHFSDAEGYSASTDVVSVLEQMGFLDGDLERLTDSLSGGEKTRLALARILLEEPDLLILDEPTNHLDLAATEWLERWINAYHGAVILVSHDRVFLQNTARRTLEIRNQTLYDYPGGFDTFLKLKAENDARLADAAAKQAAQAAKLDEFVRRFMNSQRTAQARGRQKMLHRLLENRIEVPQNDRGMAANFGGVKRSGDLVLECLDLAVGFEDETLYEGLDWTVRWRDRWGVIGENGAGKSTLIKTVLGRHPQVSGSVRLGKSIDLAYFSQDTAALDLDDTPIGFVMDETGLEAAPARDLLGRFLFSGDDVFRPINTLSGGEKNKLVLATLVQACPNLLVLDEPTNHLDMDSREALAKVLTDYPGTLVLISHDRWLLGQVTQHILDVKRSGPVVFLGGYTEYRDRAFRSSPEQTPQASKPTAPAPSQPTLTPYELSKEIGRLKKEVSAAEDSVSEQELVLARLESDLAKPDPDADILSLTTTYQAARTELDNRLSAWERACEALAKYEAMLGSANR